MRQSVQKFPLTSAVFSPLLVNMMPESPPINLLGAPFFCLLGKRTIFSPLPRLFPLFWQDGLGPPRLGPDLFLCYWLVLPYPFVFFPEEFFQIGTPSASTYPAAFPSSLTKCFFRNRRRRFLLRQKSKFPFLPKPEKSSLPRHPLAPPPLGLDLFPLLHETFAPMLKPVPVTSFAAGCLLPPHAFLNKVPHRPLILVLHSGSPDQVPSPHFPCTNVICLKCHRRLNTAHEVPPPFPTDLLLKAPDKEVKPTFPAAHNEIPPS